MIHFENLSFTYPGMDQPAVHDLSLHIPEGEFVLVAGQSGAGKSTFLRCLNGLVPHFSGGVLSGRIRVAGLDPVLESPKKMSQLVGFVFQDPESQFVMDTVEDDIAFTLENSGYPPRQIQQRITEVLARLDISRLKKRKIHTLSGGERQRVAIASAIVCSPPILALDEPTSQLDPIAANEILEAITELRKQLNLTVLLSEHRLDRVLAYADRLIYFESADPKTATQDLHSSDTPFAGEHRFTMHSGPPGQVLSCLSKGASLVSLPPLAVIGLRLGWRPLPLSIQQARPYAERFLIKRSKSSQAPVERAHQDKKPILQINSLEVSIGKRKILAGIDLSLLQGEILALMGSNGAGKTTLLRSIVGLQKTNAGSLSLNGREISKILTAEICQQIGYLPQDPNALLFAERVSDELRATLNNHQIPVDEDWLDHLLSQLGMLAEAERYPRDLSVGQRQRVALGAILVTRPHLILLDEPTRGMDGGAKKELLGLLQVWRDEGKSILLVTHDVEMVAAAADRVALMNGGRIEKSGPPGEILPEFGEFAPQTVQLFPGEGWLTEIDLIQATAQPNA